VFDGMDKMYTELDIPNATDIYGLTKFAGEIDDSYNLTLRTSIIGREIATKHGLVEWFLSHRKQSVNGYTKSIFSGFTTIELSNIVANIISKEENITGLKHVSADPISKYDLICMINELLPPEDKVEITPIDGEVINRSLDSSLFKNIMNRSLISSPFRSVIKQYSLPSWKSMIRDMMNDPTPYDKIRG
jgi:dTDP-4-dehydrorhamnose reductase